MTAATARTSEFEVPVARERRRTPRFAFSETTEIVVPPTRETVLARTSDISGGGCYVDLQNPLPEGTFIRMTISGDCGSLVTEGRVVYIQQRIGMGVAFQPIAESQNRVLNSWLASLERGS